MPRDYNINVNINGGNRRGAFSGGNVYKTKTTLDSGGMNNNGDSHSGLNLSRVFSIGLAFNTAQKYNELAGAYTQNRLRQNRINTAMTFAKYGIGLYVNPLAGVVYAGSDLAYRTIQYNIDVEKKNRQATYYRQLSGNDSYSGRRYRGGLL